MKITLASVLVFLLSFSVYSQTTPAPYQQNKYVPLFEIQKTDNSVFSSAKLKRNTPVILMYFSPTCDHCIKQFEGMIKRIKEFKDCQIVMATYQPTEELAEFNKKYKISQYPNIITGRDVKYFFPPFYHFSNFPFLAFYNKQGLLNGVNEGNMTIDNMLKKVK